MQMKDTCDVHRCGNSLFVQRITNFLEFDHKYCMIQPRNVVCRVFYKQRNNKFFPVSTYAFAMAFSHVSVYTSDLFLVPCAVLH